MDPQDAQYERLMVALDLLRARLPKILAEARAARAVSVAARAQSARIRTGLVAPAVQKIP